MNILIFSLWAVFGLALTGIVLWIVGAFIGADQEREAVEYIVSKSREDR